jgi:phosphatidylserine/phosphatidylglycerophosphate/cardiolipin synthase-like enzyme
MVKSISRADAIAAVLRARSVRAGAYLLADGPMRAALETAARAGARVSVRLEGDPRHGNAGPVALNRAAAPELRAAGADVRLVPGMHIKAVVCDGVAYLDDRNWAAGDAVLADDRPCDVRAIADCIDGRPHRDPPGLWTNKHDAVRAETRMLERAPQGARVDVESERFGVSPQTYAALKRLALRGAHCRLLLTKSAIDDRARVAIAHLRAAGVEVRAGKFDEKMALVDSRRAWAGSANATPAESDPDQTEWALCTRSAPLVRGLQARFDEHWAASVRV